MLDRLYPNDAPIVSEEDHAQRNRFLVKLHGMTQFYVVRADRELQLYANPVNFDPRDPPIPISKPDDFAPDLAKEIGIYRTLGWAEPTDKALQEGRLDESAFLYDSGRAYDDRPAGAAFVG